MGLLLAGVAAGAVAFLLGATEDEAGHNRAREGRARLDAALLAAETMRKSARDLFAALEFVHAEAGTGANGLERTRRVTTATRASPAWEQVDAAWDRLLEALREAEAALRWLAAAVEDVDDVASADLAEAGERHELLMSDLANTLKAATETAAKYAAALDAPESGRVYWLEQNPSSDRIMFRSAPLDVSQLLQDRLFKRTRTTVLTSATMAIDGSCDYIATRLGIPDATSLIVPSPFDYRRSALLYLADDMPEPTHPVYQEALESHADRDAGRYQRQGSRPLHVAFSVGCRCPRDHEAIAGAGNHCTRAASRRIAAAIDRAASAGAKRGRVGHGHVLGGGRRRRRGAEPARDHEIAVQRAHRIRFSPRAAKRSRTRSMATRCPRPSFGSSRVSAGSSAPAGTAASAPSSTGEYLTKRYGATFVQSLPECTVAVGSAARSPHGGKPIGWIGRGEESVRTGAAHANESGGNHGR